MKYLMFYEMAAGGLSKAQANFPAHHSIHEWLEALAP
jgi:hypothetical protein